MPAKSRLNIATILPVLFVIGLPSIFLTMLWCNRATLDTERTRAWLGFLYVKYRREKWFWEEIELLRKLVLTSMVVLVRPGSILQIVAAMSVTFIWLVLLAINKPYRNQSDTYVALGMYVAQHVALWGGLLKRVQVADEFGGTEVFNGILVFTMVFPIGLVAVLLVVQVSNKVGDKLRERNAAKAAAAEDDAKAEADEAAAKAALGGGGGARTAPAEVQRELSAAAWHRRDEASQLLQRERMAVQRLASSFCADGGAAREPSVRL